ncbi:MAG: hypothetical protein K2X99_04105 [Gemmatimonadaceae bacterium]|nr:hypothetical protein [Gemmatimonadaceae bacterium]
MNRSWKMVVVVVLAACGGGDTPNVEPPALQQTSFARLQTQVLLKSCALSGCHVPGSRLTSLDLSGTDAAAKLINQPPSHPNALADGLKLVRPGQPDSSLFYHKLSWVPGHHARDYGAPMPIGGTAVSAEQLEFVRRWILAGASATSDAIDPQLLTGSTAQVSTTYAPLTRPEQGFQLTLGPFQVAPQFEREFFQYLPVGNVTDIYVNRIQMQMRTGSHHLIAYDFTSDLPAIFRPATGAIRDIRNPDGSQNLLNMIAMPYHLFLAGAQSPTTEYRFPAGVALRVPANARLDLNSHYVNPGRGEITGQAEVNLFTVPQSAVQQVAQALFLNNQNITIPAGRDTTIRTSFTFPARTTILSLTSHMHKRGIRFVVRMKGGPRDGELLYDTNDWEHPLIKEFATPLVLQPGEGLTSEVTYRGDPSKVVRFGLTSDDEMGIIFGYWY